MARFQHIVLVVATIILIISLLIAGVMLWKKRFSKLFPPVLPGCPDYWKWNANVSSNVVDCTNSNCTGLEGQYCPPGAPGSTKGGYCCINGTWGGKSRRPGKCAPGPTTGMCVNGLMLGKMGQACEQTTPITDKCEALSYADNCGVVWDGITNNSSIKKQCSKKK